MTSIDMMKWSLRALIAVTIVLLFTNLLPVAILLMAIDVHFGVFYAMMRSKCDRRQMKHMPMAHRL